MKLVTKVFILIESLDIITTLIGLGLGLTEGNPLVNSWGLGGLIAVKTIAVFIISYLMEYFEFGWLAWIPTITAAVPVVVNVYLIASLML